MIVSVCLLFPFLILFLIESAGGVVTTHEYSRIHENVSYLQKFNISVTLGLHCVVLCCRLVRRWRTSRSQHPGLPSRPWPRRTRATWSAPWGAPRTSSARVSLDNTEMTLIHFLGFIMSGGSCYVGGETVPNTEDFVDSETLTTSFYTRSQSWWFLHSFFTCLINKWGLLQVFLTVLTAWLWTWPHCRTAINTPQNYWRMFLNVKICIECWMKWV